MDFCSLNRPLTLPSPPVGERVAEGRVRRFEGSKRELFLDSISPIGGEGWGEGAGLGKQPAISFVRPVRSINACEISNRTAPSSPRN